ncbi:MAG: FkbM family methyltransferase [Candidatus Eiseniibacteriota bacterium]|nr:MAG: FkbM family methyltransferase [Candidatus Eisenbacteria bacterium]
MFETREGLLWPTGDRGLFGHRHTIKTLDEEILPWVSSRKVCVQAGGAAGEWPHKLAQEFEQVYTFEPNPALFHCLCHNCPDLNVVKLNAALGNERELIHVDNPEKGWNYGSYYVHKGGNIPTFKIDDLALQACDLIMLDIEGYELQALYGAEETIKAYKPIIVVEAHADQYERHGDSLNELQKWLEAKKYHKVPIRSARDWLFR